MPDKIYLGVHNDQPIHLTKHSWDCDWYWGFGYLGNRSWHYHFSSVLKDGLRADQYFSSSRISNDDWWVIRELFAQAYALEDAYGVYLRNTAGQTNRKGVTDLVGDKELAARINLDLEKILDKVWEFTWQAVNKET
jgi:hypothetical protein